METKNVETGLEFPAKFRSVAHLNALRYHQRHHTVVHAHENNDKTKYWTANMSAKKDFFNMVTVGDSQTGKTSLLCALKDGKLSPDKEIPGVFQTFSHKLKVDGHKVELGLWDTSGEAKYDGLRRLAYPTCDVFIVCYSVNSRESFENVSKVWLPELQRYGPPSAPIVIVGTKQDSRPRASLIPNGSSGGVTQQKFVNYEEGMRLADESRANAFVECSALSENGVSGVFAEAVKAVLKHIKDGKRRRSSGGISIRSLLPGHSAK